MQERSEKVLLRYELNLKFGPNIFELPNPQQLHLATVG